MKRLLPACLWIAVCFARIGTVGLASFVGAALAEETAGVAEETSEPAARAVVARLEAALLDIMKRADALGFEGRLREISPVLEATFDLEFMARTSIGRVWNDLTPALQSRWVESFSRYTSGKFAGQFDRFSGQEFVLAGERPASHSTLIVMTRIEREAKEPVRLDFRVRPTSEGWRIIDVYGMGRVSELALRRSEYDAILKQGGIEELIESVDEHRSHAAEIAVAQDAQR